MRILGLILLCAHLGLGDLNVENGSQPHDAVTLEQKISPIATKFSVSGSSNPSVGDTLVFTCNVTGDEHNKADETKLQLVWTKAIDNSTMVLATETASRGIHFTLSSIKHEHRGLYSCLNDGSNPDIITKDRHTFVWIKDPPVSVSIEVIRENRVNFFHDKTVTLGCRVPDDNSQWKFMRCDDELGFIEECPGQVKKDNIVSCTVPAEFPPRMPYWCQSADGQMGNVFTLYLYLLTVRERRHSEQIVGTRFTVGPAWYLRPGDSAGLDCHVHTDHHNNSNHMDLQLIWTQLHTHENNMEVLLSQRASQGFTHSLVNVTHEHQGVYTCWDDGTRANVSSHPWHHFIWVEDDSPRVTIEVLSHNRTQFFHAEEVTLGCQLPDDQSQWQIKWFDQWTGQITNCAKSQLSSSRFLSCVKKMGQPWSTKLFWCESSTGERSNLLNTTLTAHKIILEAPTTPVTEGEDVTLRCLILDRKTNTITPATRANFFINFHFIGKSEGDTMTVHVTKAKEGFYQCSTSEEKLSHKTWITVKARD